MSDTLWQRLTHGVRRVRQKNVWRQFAGADWPDEIMDVAVSDRFNAKQGRSTCRWELHQGERKLAVFLKRHYVLPRWMGFLAALWPNRNWSPGVEEWQGLEWARLEGVPVPAALAAGEFIGPWGRLQSFLAVEELADMLPLHKAVPLAAKNLSPDEFRVWKSGLVVEMARVARLLHDRRRYHKDLYLCHHYVRISDCSTLPDWFGRVHMIDFHRLTHHPLTSLWWQVKDLAELLYSSDIPGIDARDRLHFWHAYMGPRRKSRRSAWLLGMVLWKWRLYRRHNRKKDAKDAPCKVTADKT